MRSFFNRAGDVVRRLTQPLGLQAPGAATGTEAHAQFLRDLALGSPNAARLYWRLASDPRTARAELAGHGIEPQSDAALADALCVFVAASKGLTTNTDWVAEPDYLLHEFDAQLAAHGVQTTDAQKVQVIGYANTHIPMERGDFIGWMYGPMAALAAQHGLKVINLQDGSDAYKFAVVTPDVYQRWLGFAFSDTLSVEDPSVQFAQQLTGSPYAVFLR